MMKKWLAIGGLILVTVIWGGGFVASDMALGSMKPFQIMMVRFLLASVLMGMISMGQHKKEGKLENRAGAIKAGILMGIALFAGFALQIIGLQYTTPSKNAFLTALNVVIVPFIAFIILKKKVGMKGIIGAIMSVIGVALLSLNGNLTLSLGDGLTLLCAVGFAFQSCLTGEFVKEYLASVLNMVQMITAFVLSAVSLVIFGENDFQVTTQGWLSVLYLGVISTTVCYLLQTACQKYVDETKAAIVLSMESVFGTIFSIIILHEVITLRMVIGCAIILAAVIISNLSETEGEAISAAFSPPATVLWERIAARLSLDFDAISPFPPVLPISFLSTCSFHVFDLYFLSFEKIFEKERKQFHKLTSFQFLLDIFLINQRNVLLLHHL